MEPFREPNALQIRDEIEPAIWRPHRAPDLPLSQLHLVIQAAFNWWNYHLHEFRIGGLCYGDQESDDRWHETSARTFDDREVRLLDLDRRSGLAFTYLYDF